MEIKINDIGVLNNVFVECNSITLVTGKNGSGKTSIIKSIGSLFQGLENLYDNFASPLMYECINQLRKLFDENGYVPSLYRFPFVSDSFNKIKSFISILFNRLSSYDLKYSLFIVNKACDDLYVNKEISILFIEKYLSVQNIDYKWDKKILDKAEIIYERTLYILSDTYKKLSDSSDVKISYANEYIKRQFDYNFNGQVKPLFKSKCNPGIEIKENNFSYMFSYEETTNDKLLSYDSRSILPNLIYISDSDVIENIYKGTARRTRLENGLTNDFNTKLINLIKKEDSFSINRSLESNPKINILFNEVLPYKYIKKDNMLIRNTDSLRVENEASGKKIFVILRLLMENGCLDNKTIIVFDEPDNHLHPEWQITFCELLIELNKVFGTKFICVTHNPNLLHAFDVKSKQNENMSSLKVYYCDNSNFSIVDCTQSIDIAYRKLLEPYITLTAFGE